MGALTFFEERLRGSDWGEPTDRESTGFDVRILEYMGFVHIEMVPPDGDESKRYVALFSLSEARRFLDAFGGAIDRVKAIGEK